ncbi:MAG: M23 family metallopeptidase [Rhodobacteraceae bacterium]|nr:M23 family metallopeptidase [Paracoccaceae bacterium]
MKEGMAMLSEVSKGKMAMVGLCASWSLSLRAGLGVGMLGLLVACESGITPDLRGDLNKDRSSPAAAVQQSELPPAQTDDSGTDARPDSQAVDIAALAQSAIDAADAPEKPPQSAVWGAGEHKDVRHQVERGETAFSIARLYGVSPRALAERNALDRDFTVVEGQILLVPSAVLQNDSGSGGGARASRIARPGGGTQTPPPPAHSSAPQAEADAAPADIPPPATPDLQQSAQPASLMSPPVRGKIIRPYVKGSNDGIDIAAQPATPVYAADDGTVAMITNEADSGAQIIVLRHADNLMTVYANVADVRVQMGQSVPRGTPIARLPQDNPYIHFEVRRELESLDPVEFIQ